MWDKASCYLDTDTETIACIRDMATQRASFDFFFGLLLGELLLPHTDNLSRSLQSPKTTAAEGQAVASTITSKTLASLRNDDHFKLLWARIGMMAEEKGIGEPTLPRRRNAPRRFESGNALAEFPTTPVDRFCQNYFEALYVIVQSITDRFDQPGYSMCQCLETADQSSQ